MHQFHTGDFLHPLVLCCYVHISLRTRIVRHCSHSSCAHLFADPFHSSDLCVGPRRDCGCVASGMSNLRTSLQHTNQITTLQAQPACLITQGPIHQRTVWPIYSQLQKRYSAPRKNHPAQILPKKDIAQKFLAKIKVVLVIVALPHFLGPKVLIVFYPLQAPLSCTVYFCHRCACCSDCCGGCVPRKTWFVSPQHNLE
jgi:hypothetical protein